MAELIEISSIDKVSPSLDQNGPVITLKEDNSAPTTPTTEKPSVNFGDGIELLMNDKRKNDPSKKDNDGINMNDLDDLEEELNDLATEKTPSKSGLFNKNMQSDGGIKLNVNTVGEIKKMILSICYTKYFNRKNNF